MTTSSFTFTPMLRALLPAALFLATLVLPTSCKKESDIGLGLQPGDDLLNAQLSDTITLWTKTEIDDSLRSDKTTLCVIGSNNDPLFGKTMAGLYAQFLIPGTINNINFGNTPVLDSTVLLLRYNFDYFGDTTTQQTFNVFQMTESINKDSAYYSTNSKTFNTSPIGTLTFVPRPRTSVTNGPDTLPAHLRIVLDPAFGSSIFALASGAGNTLADNAELLAALNGLFIAPNNPAQAPGQGALLYFAPKDSLTRLTMYYRDDANVNKTFSFTINSQSAYFGSYQHDYSSSAAITNQLNTPTGGPYSFSEIFVHSLGGLRTRILFPFIAQLRRDVLGYNIAINKAELVIKVDPVSSADPNLPPNTRLYVTSFNDEGKQQLLTDFLVPASNFDGNYNPSTGEYHINMAIYFQRLIDGQEPNTGLLLKEIVPNNNARRAVLGSGLQASPNQMKLRLTYTRVN
ncbi:MAG: DUF4270 family protein [Bacteroidia bacterium]